MGIAITLEQYLDRNGISYDCLVHERTGSSTRTAEVANVPGECIAKGVVLRRKEGYLLAVLPASAQVKLDEVGRWLGQPIGLAGEDEIDRLFPDCEHGAVPPVAAAYAMQALIDESLDGKRDVYFEAGDHRTLVHLTGDQFQRLMRNEPHARFSRETADPIESHYGGA